MKNTDQNLKTRSNEEALLGSIILNQKCLDEIALIINEEDFLFDDLKEIYKVCVKLHETGVNIDLTSLSSVINKNDLLIKLISDIPSSSNYNYYANLVKDDSVRRKLKKLNNTVTTKLEGDVGVNEIIKFIEEEIVDSTVDNSQKEVITFKDAITDVLDRVEMLREDPKDVSGIKTGIDYLDKKINGLNSTDLVILAARPGCGKSTLALQIAKNAAFIEDKNVMMFSLEMGTEQLVQRILANDSKVDLWKIRAGKLDDIEMQALKMSARKLQASPLFFNDMAGISVKDIRSQIRLHNAKHENNIDLIIVDYLQLLAGGSQNLVQQVTEISRALKVIAKEFNIPVLALSQLSRAVESRGGKPKLSDLRDSGSIEQDADIVMFLHRDKTQEETVFGIENVDLMIEKHRNGPTGEVKLEFNGSKMTFTEQFTF